MIAPTTSVYPDFSNVIPEPTRLTVYPHYPAQKKDHHKDSGKKYQNDSVDGYLEEIKDSQHDYEREMYGLNGELDDIDNDLLDLVDDIWNISFACSPNL